MVKATPTDDNNNTENRSTYPIMVELKGRMIGGTEVEQIAGIGQVFCDVFS